MKMAPKPLAAPARSSSRKWLANAGIVAAVLLVVALIIGACGIYIYSLTSPEAYVQVERWKAILGYGSYAALLLLIGGVWLIDRAQRAWRRRRANQATDKKPPAPPTSW